MFEHSKLTHTVVAAALAASMWSTPSVSEPMPDLWGEPVKFSHTLSAENITQQGGAFNYVPLHPIYFEPDKAVINHEAQRALDAAVEFLSKQTNITRIIIEGFTDSVGNRKYNDGLSDRRTAIVRSYLTINGIDPELFAPVGYGEYHPVDENWTREGRKRNRQVAIYAVQRVN